MPVGGVMQFPFQNPNETEEEILADWVRFQALPPEEKWAEIRRVCADGWRAIESSPQRDELVRYMEEQEELGKQAILDVVRRYHNGVLR
jgi:hypothetical protein